MSSASKDGLPYAAIVGNAVQDQCTACLDRLVAESGSTLFACLGTVDGRLIAAHSSAQDNSRLAAMACSLLALSESFAKEALRGNCMHSTVVTSQGVIVSVRVPASRRSYVLSIGADAGETMAMVLRHALDTAEKIAGILDSAA